MISKGYTAPLGAIVDADGTHFSLYSAGADAVELCLFDAAGNETHQHLLPECVDAIWRGYLPACQAGQRYGYRVHGRYSPAEGLRFNRHKLLIDPYAQLLDGEFIWSPAVFDFHPAAGAEFSFNDLDSAPFVPKSVVTSPLPPLMESRPRIAWADTIIYEANVRGFTMQHPGLTPAERGLFRGMRNGQILDYLSALGITAIELMPVHAFIDEQFLQRRGLRNFWGYNSINFFAPANRYVGQNGVTDGRAEFREMVAAIHDAGIEVIMDVVYNHTGESDELGPSLSFRGIDNLAYYRTTPGNPGEYINDTGCGNTINVDNPVVHELVMDSLRYWSHSMGVDGFRFDLATILGRHQHGFSTQHPLLHAITSDPQLKNLKMIAEPWDPGPGGYQLGNFASGWSEWNDSYRDCIRRFWRGDAGLTGKLAQRLHGSADLFDTPGRAPAASINFIASHDGFTLTDTVAYELRHNEANGEKNQDGHRHNFSSNYAVEGPTDDVAINRVRRRQRLNMLATLLLSQGTPMLLAGDEFGNSQAGNNNAYPQDNPTGWLDWAGVHADPEFLQSVQTLIKLRLATPLLRPTGYRHGHAGNDDGWRDIEWRNPAGNLLDDADWHSSRTINMLLANPSMSGERNADALHGDESGTNDSRSHGATDDRAIAVLINGLEHSVDFWLPASSVTAHWELLFASEPRATEMPDPQTISLPAQSIACLRLR